MSYAVGIDIGGTHIRLAIVSKTGKIEQVIKEKTDKSNGDRKSVV